jgi:hypothetical protein
MTSIERAVISSMILNTEEVSGLVTKVVILTEQYRQNDPKLDNLRNPEKNAVQLQTDFDLLQSRIIQSRTQLDDSWSDAPILVSTNPARKPLNEANLSESSHRWTNMLPTQCNRQNENNRRGGQNFFSQGTAKSPKYCNQTSWSFASLPRCRLFSCRISVWN